MEVRMRTVDFCGPVLLLSVVCYGTYALAAPPSYAPGEVGPGGGAAPCAIRGVWALESVAVGGQPQVPAEQWRQIKLVTDTHFAWVGQGAGPEALRSAADSLAAFRTRGFGGGTYQVTDTTYTENIEYFFDPEWIGREITFSCRVQADRWYHITEYPTMEGGRETGRVRVDEVWRRLE
jgi:hypothetical protein